MATLSETESNKMKRREFLKSSLAASAIAGLSHASGAAAAGSAVDCEHYELRVYRLKSGASHELLDGYLEKAAIPALNRQGVKTVAAFTEIESKEAPAVCLLIPHPSLQSFGTALERVNGESSYQNT